MTVSVVILTYNEELNLPACLKSLSQFSDIHVLDSGSTDATKKIAEQSGATVSEHPFESFGKQRNWALDNLALNEWTLFLDADERASEQFTTELFSKIKLADSSVAGYYCCWKTIIDDVWLRRCDMFPRWQFRIVRKNKARFIDFGHGQKETILSGEAKYLSEPYLHYPLNKGWNEWRKKHIHYAQQDAMKRLSYAFSWSDLLSKHQTERAKALRFVLRGVPGWPLLRFLMPYIFKLGFLEGKVGYTFCRNMAWYEQLIIKKSRALKSQELPIED